MQDRKEQLNKTAASSRLMLSDRFKLWGTCGSLILLVALVASAGRIGSRAVSEGSPKSESEAPADRANQARLPGELRLSATETADPEAMEQRLLETARYLAADELEGRGVGTDGLDLAAEHIARQYAEIGLNTRLYEGEAFDHFSRTHRLALGSTNQATLTGPDGTKIELVLDENFMPLSLSGSGSFDLPMAFVGYGITAPEWGYDDYRGMDVKGKAVVMLRHEPQQGDPRSPFDGIHLSEYAYFPQKIANAVEHGATAVLLCTSRYEIDRLALENDLPEQAAESQRDPLLDFKVRASLGERRIPVMHCRRSVIERVVELASRESLSKLEQAIDVGPKPHSRELKEWRIAGEVSVLKKGRTLKNVLGMLAGDGSCGDETIVVGAHYDHLGWGGWGSLAWGIDDQIHNGADDNASGTAVLLEVARQLAARQEQLRRRVLFIAFTAEEMGLVGSEHYVGDPLVPLDQTVAMLNLDMVGRLRDEHLTVSGTGTAVEFAKMIDRLGKKYEFRVTQQSSGYGPSDHASFHERGVPVMHFFTGLHEDYHRPGDDFDKLNLAGMQRIARMFADAVVEISRAEHRPQRRVADEWDLLADETDVPVIAGNDPVALISLGIDAGQPHAETGYILDRLEIGGAAAALGFRSGDVILKIDKSPVNSADDLRSILSRRKPGEKIRLQFQRRGIELAIEMTLGVR